MITLAVKLHVPDGWTASSPTARKHVLDAATAYLEDFFNSLELPTDPSVEIKQDARMKRHIVRMRVGTRHARVFVNAAPWENEDDLVANVTRAMFRGRCLFVTEQVVERVWARWPKGDRIRELGLRRWLIAEAVQHGLRVSALGRAIADGDERITDARGAQKLFEEAFRFEGTVSIRLSKELYDRCVDPNTGKPGSSPRGAELAQALDTAADGLFAETGLRLSLRALRWSTACQAHAFQLQLNDMPLPPTRGLLPDQVLTNASPAELKSNGTAAAPAVNPATGQPAAVVSGAGAKKAVESAGHATWSPEGYLVLHLVAAVRADPGALVTWTVWLYDQIQLITVVQVIMKGVTRQDWEIIRLIRTLVEEGISVRDRLTILDELAAPVEIPTADTSNFIVYSVGGMVALPSHNSQDSGTDDLTSRVRHALKRYISFRATAGGIKLLVYLVHDDVEQRIRSIDMARFVIGDGEDICTAARKVLGDVMVGSPTPVILTDRGTRRRLRLALALEFPHVPVVSWNELSADTDIEPVAWIQ